MAGPRLLTQVGLDEASRKRRLALLELGPEDAARLAALRDFAHTHLDALVENVNTHLRRFAEPRRLLGDETRIEHLTQLQRAYLLRMVEGRLDADYFESRLRVGAAHARSDVRPEWYLGAYSLYLRFFLRRLGDHFQGDPGQMLDVLESVSKLLFLDIGLATDAYITSAYVDRALAQEYRRTAEVAERTLREKADLERLKADLTGMIVHDLKGPLGGILTVVQLALRKRGDLPPEHVRHFEQIQRSARDLMRMIENLLEIDQMEEGRLELRVEPVEIGPLLRECAEEFRPAAEAVGQSIGVTAGDDLPVVVTDRWLLRRVLNNLVVNAIRHSGAIGRIDLAALARDGRLEVRVRDAGRGIPAEMQATLFVKETRRGRRDHRDDTGLGLVFCKMAVETMGGTIAVVSAPGAGTTFTLSLPMAAEA